MCRKSFRFLKIFLQDLSWWVVTYCELVTTVHCVLNGPNIQYTVHRLCYMGFVIFLYYCLPGLESEVVGEVSLSV